jgi:hypothetical protein
MVNGLDKVRFGAGASASTIHPAVLVWMVIAIVLIFALPRRHVIIPLVITLFLTPFGQQIYIGGVHLFATRIVILCGLIRMAGTRLEGGFTVLDKLFALWVGFRVAATLLLFPDLQAAINQGGFLWDYVGGYFLFRLLLRDQEDIVRTVKLFAVLVSVLAVTMTAERLTGSNLFRYIGGVALSEVRDGTIRAQGSFQGPIPAGTFAATLMCLFVWLWLSGTARLIGFGGMVGAVVMIVTSASSTPLMTIAAAIVAIAFWPIRGKMRLLRWGIVVGLISLHMVMKAPVWMIIDHISLVGGNSSYHRAMLVDHFIRHFSDWWLIGVKSTAEWGWDMWDQANQFVWEGESGGLATFVCFVLLISRSFGLLGSCRKLGLGDRQKEWQCWLFGSSLFAYVVAFFGISLADQLKYGWLALLAMLCAMGTPAWTARQAPQQIEQTEDLEVVTPPVAAFASRQTSELTAAWIARQRGTS